MRRLLLLLPAALAGCQLGYYAHLARGQYELLSARRPVAELIADEAVDPALKARLVAAGAARAFAVRHLRLPDQGSYTRYADLGRPFALYSVVAAPEFSLAPHQWCYPIGCFPYRGYYHLRGARSEAARLRAEGYDAYVVGNPAYSTLGWFEDPLLNTMLRWSDAELAGLIFHELAHEALFVRDDIAFNESFATFIGQQGLREFLREAPEQFAAAERDQRRDAEFRRLLLDTRTRLEGLYASGLPRDAMRARKQAEFTRLRVGYEQLKRDAWGGDRRFDRWMDEPLDNAHLVTVGLYHQWVPAFAALFADSGGDWPAFHLAAQALAARPPAERKARLEALAARRPAT